MDEWLFISLAKTKADAPGFGARAGAQEARPALTKAETAAALDLAVVEERPAFRGAAAFVGAMLVNAAFITAIDDSALDARTPKGQVIVAQLEPIAITTADERTSTYEAAVNYVQ